MITWKSKLLSIFAIVAVSFLVSGCATTSQKWNDNSTQYEEILVQEYPAGMDREEIQFELGNPTATYIYSTNSGWPSVMDSYLSRGIKILEKNETYPVKIDVYNRFLARYQNHDGNYGRYVDYLFYNVNDELVASHRRKIN